MLRNVRVLDLSRVLSGPSCTRMLADMGAKVINPRIIHCSISGFGQTGPETRRLAYTDIVQAYSGLDYIAGKMGEPDAADLLLERDTELTRTFFVNRRTIPYPPEPLRTAAGKMLLRFMRREDSKHDRFIMKK